MKRNNMKYRQRFHRHPVSGTLLAFYLFTSLVQGNMELFLAGLLAAAGAFGLETIFHVTGAIGMPRSRAGTSDEDDVKGTGQKDIKTGLYLQPGTETAAGGLCEEVS